MTDINLSNLKGEKAVALSISFHLEKDADPEVISEMERRAISHGYNFAAQVLMESLCKFPYKITMPCGHVHEIKSLDDIPSSSLPCPCGDPNHIIVSVNIDKTVR